MKVKPQEAPEHQEWMQFSFTDVGSDSATLALTWDKLQVPISIQVDTHARTLESIRAQLTGVARFGWRGPYQAANYCVQNELECEEAMTWVDSSIQNEERFENLALKSQLLEARERRTRPSRSSTRRWSRATPTSSSAMACG